MLQPGPFFTVLALLTGSTSNAVTATVSVHHQTPPVVHNVSIPAHGCVDLELDQTATYGTAVDTYGVVTVEAPGSGQVMAEMIRSRLIPGTSDLDYRAPTEVR